MEGSYVYTFNEDKVCPVVGVMNENHWIAEKNGNIVLIDKDTICQYIGLTDKNGNKIWENDVVMINSRKYKIFYYPPFAMCMLSDVNTGGGVTGINIQIANSEVIGNIFDNPEPIGE